MLSRNYANSPTPSYLEKYGSKPYVWEGEKPVWGPNMGTIKAIIDFLKVDCKQEYLVGYRTSILIQDL